MLYPQAMNYSRRNFLTALGMVSAGLAAPMSRAAEEAGPWRKPHLVTLSFDDGFKKSFARIAEIYEKHKLSACLNVVAAGLPGDAYIKMRKAGARSVTATLSVCWSDCWPTIRSNCFRQGGR